MKIIINLLPPERREDIEEKKKMRLIAKIGMMAFLAIICCVVFLWMCLFIIEIQIDSAKEQRELLASGKYKEIEDARNFIEEYYVKTNLVEKKIIQQKKHSLVLAEMEKVIGKKEIYLKQILLEGQNFSISGFSLSRDDLMMLKEEIEKSDYFYEIESPISNFTSNRDIEFSFKGKIK